MIRLGLVSHNIEKHPYNSLLSCPPDTVLLVIGTAPPHRFCNRGMDLLNGDVEFYYGSRDNQFWSNIIPKVYGLNFDAGTANARKEKMIAFLTDRRFWTFDVAEEFTRGKSQSALDKHLNIIKGADFRSLFMQLPKVDTMVFTGGRAERETFRQLKNQGLLTICLRTSDRRMPRRHEISLLVGASTRSIVAHTLPSPSRLTRRTHAVAVKAEYYKVISHRCP